jgi:hypothetical protein
MFVFVEEAAGAVGSADVRVGDGGWVGDRLGEAARRSGIGDAPMGPVRVVVPLILAQGVEQVRLVPDAATLIPGASSSPWLRG